MKRFGQFLANQRFIDHLGHSLHIRNLGFANVNIRTFVSDWRDVLGYQAIAFNDKDKTRWELDPGGLCFNL